VPKVVESLLLEERHGLAQAQSQILVMQVEVLVTQVLVLVTFALLEVRSALQIHQGESRPVG
jgi:uncharacterized membrane protein